jgi:hypothetical protein
VTKQTGLGDNLWIDGIDVSGDIGSLGAIGGGNDPLTVTGIDKRGIERLGGLRDGRIEFSSYFNDAPGPGVGQGVHTTLKTLPAGDRLLTYAKAPALGSEAAYLTAKQVNFDGERGDDGSFTFETSAQANAYGLGWSKLLTAGKRTDVAPTNGASVDDGAGTAFGVSFWCHVFAFTGTSVTMALQMSSDNGGGDPFTDVLGGFSQLTFTGVGGQAQRLAPPTFGAAISVERWLRVVTTGTFSNAVFAYGVERHPVAVAY